MIEHQIWRTRLQGFAREVGILFGDSEGSYLARTYNAHESLTRVARLSFEQSDALKQAVRCVEAGLYRAAFVMAWTSVADLLLLAGAKYESDIKAIRPRWKFLDRHSLAEEQGDHAIIQALKDAGIVTKAEMKTLHGLLHRRNQCAHPSGVFPTANEALGYVDETISAAEKLIKKI